MHWRSNNKRRKQGNGWPPPPRGGHSVCSTQPSRQMVGGTGIWAPSKILVFPVCTIKKGCGQVSRYPRQYLRKCFSTLTQDNKHNSPQSQRMKARRLRLGLYFKSQASKEDAAMASQHPKPANKNVTCPVSAQHCHWCTAQNTSHDPNQPSTAISVLHKTRHMTCIGPAMPLLHAVRPAQNSTPKTHTRYVWSPNLIARAHGCVHIITCA